MISSKSLKSYSISKSWAQYDVRMPINRIQPYRITNIDFAEERFLCLPMTILKQDEMKEEEEEEEEGEEEGLTRNRSLLCYAL